MNSAEEVMEVIFIGLVAATFLFNTCRLNKAIELWKECLVLLDDGLLVNEDMFVKLVCKVIYGRLFQVYCQMYDYTNNWAYILHATTRL